MSDTTDSRFTPPVVYEAVVQHMRDAVIVTDRAGIIRVWNNAAHAVFGFTAQEAIARDLRLIVPERFWQAHEAGYRRAVAGGQMRTEGRVLTTRALHKSGRKLYVDFTFSLLKDAGGEVWGVVAVGRDVTARYLEETARKTPAS